MLISDRFSNMQFLFLLLRDKSVVMADNLSIKHNSITFAFKKLTLFKCFSLWLATYIRVVRQPYYVEYSEKYVIFPERYVKFWENCIKFSERFVKFSERYFKFSENTHEIVAKLYIITKTFNEVCLNLV